MTTQPDYVIATTKKMAEAYCVEQGWPLKIAVSVKNAGQRMQGVSGTIVELLDYDTWTPALDRQLRSWWRTRDVQMAKQRLEYWT